MISKRASADPSKEAHGLYMVEKYERVIDYLYPLAQTISRKHGTFRELFIRQLFLVAEQLNDAASSWHWRMTTTKAGVARSLLGWDTSDTEMGRMDSST
jgi:hypothetical protein